MIIPQIDNPKRRKRNELLLPIAIIISAGILIGVVITASISLKTYSMYENQIYNMTNDLNDVMKVVQDQDTQIKELKQENARLIQENNKMQEKVNRVLTISNVKELMGTVQAEDNKTLQGSMAVAQTILDRSMLWNKTSGEVVSNGYTRPSSYISSQTMLAVKLIYDDGIRIFNEPTTHFYAYNKCNPGWADYKVERGKINGHRYMY